VNALLLVAVRAQDGLPGLDLSGHLSNNNSIPWTIVFTLTLLTLLPAILLAMTPMVRLLIVFHFLRQALGTQTAITQYGVVNATLPGQQNPAQLGQIQLATFVNPGGLEGVGSNLFTATLSSGDPVLGNPGGTEGLGTLQQGYLENSNVDVVGAFVQMVLAQRAYESNSKVIRAADDMYSQVNNMAR